MQKFFTALVLIPLGVIFVVFAVANRHQVTVAYDPFNIGDSASTVTLPLFVLLIAVAILGVFAGGLATWVRQRRWRRAARQHQADAFHVRQQLAELRASVVAAPQSDTQRVPQRLLLGSSTRDKQNAAA
jgi:uncharacterized integral membrane protein